jgi:hypothetical protein
MMDAKWKWVVRAAVAMCAAAGVPDARAFTMGEQMATTGVHGAVAATGLGNPAGTLGSVKKSLASSTKPRLTVPGSGGAGSKQPATAKRASGSNSGWGSSTQGWARQGAASGAGGGSWVGSSSGWAAANGWPSAGSAWAEAGQGGAWARPGAS